MGIHVCFSYMSKTVEISQPTVEVPPYAEQYRYSFYPDRIPRSAVKGTVSRITIYCGRCFILGESLGSISEPVPQTGLRSSMKLQRFL